MLILSVLAFLGAYLPNTSETRTSTVDLIQSIQNLEPSDQVSLERIVPLPLFGECRVDLSTRWPTRMRTGLAGGIQQSMRLDCPIDIPDGLEIRAAGRFDERAQAVAPDGLIEVPLAVGSSASIVWTIQQQQAGPWNGLLWTYLYLVGKDGARLEIALSSMPVSGNSLALLGLDHAAWVTTGWILAGLGLLVMGLTKVIRLFQKSGR